MKKILITGAGRNSFIGKNLAESLIHKYDVYTPSSLELDLCNLNQLEYYIDKNQISVIIHAATYNASRRAINIENELNANLMMFYNLRHVSDRVDKIIYFGSGAEFDKRRDIILAKEEELGKYLPTHTQYGFGKYIMNSETNRSNNIYNLRLFGVYGKYENWQTCFISNLCCKAAYNLPLSIRQDCLFDFMYIDDLKSVVEWILENKPLYHEYNICTGRREKLSDIAKVIQTVAEKDLEIKFLSEGMNKEYTGSNERILKEFNNFKTRSLEEGIRELYLYYINNLSQINIDILRETK